MRAFFCFMLVLAVPWPVFAQQQGQQPGQEQGQPPGQQQGQPPGQQAGAQSGQPVRQQSYVYVEGPDNIGGYPPPGGPGAGDRGPQEGAPGPGLVPPEGAPPGTAGGGNPELPCGAGGPCPGMGAATVTTVPFIAPSDRGGVIVLYRGSLYKYDKDLNMVKKVQIE